VALVTFLKWAALLPFLCQCLVTGLAVLMIGILQLHGLALFLLFPFFPDYRVTFAALIYVILFCPDVIAVFVHMVAVCAADIIAYVMLLVCKLYSAFFVLFITLVLKLDLIGHSLLFCGSQGTTERKSIPVRTTTKVKYFVFIRFFLLLLKLYKILAIFTNRRIFL